MVRVYTLHKMFKFLHKIVTIQVKYLTVFIILDYILKYVVF